MEQGQLDWDLLAAYFGLVAFFGGLMIPLYYALAVDLVKTVNDRVKDTKPHPPAAQKIMSYVWTSDIVVFVAAGFGAAGLLIGIVITMGEYGLIPPTWALPVVIVGALVFFVIMVGVGIWQWCIRKASYTDLMYPAHALVCYTCVLAFLGLILLLWVGSTLWCAWSGCDRQVLCATLVHRP
jgi:hypothetical protein